MSRILILGGAGMLGHKAYQVLSGDHEVFVTFRNYNDRLAGTGIFEKGHVIQRVAALDLESVRNAITLSQPDVVLNCIGVIKQLEEAKNPQIAIQINALFPHLLAEQCRDMGIRFIHISTDCVFSGERGMYKESDESDAHDLYGRTKFLGEVAAEHSLTLRLSIIGHELFSSRSLIDWFLSNTDGTVKGFRNALYTGFPTCVFCRELSRVISHYPRLSGLYQVAATPISKHDLLHIVQEVYDVPINIVPDDDFRCDRSLDGEKYASKTGFRPQLWREMIVEMHRDYDTYKRWKTI
jgi:dTDP-4-dehydrorhamnose reductase